MKKKGNTISWSIIAVVIVAGIFFYYYVNKVEIPEIGPEGEVKGAYTIEGIMKLKKPYVCNFERSDESSKISGVLHINENKIFGEFRVHTPITENEFNSFLVVREKEAYVWTSIQDIGYKSPVAKSAIKNALPWEQAQIVGIKDKVEYDCEPWQEIDNTILEVPEWVEFSRFE